MTLDTDSCHRALASHDARFDGRFVVGVSSTGIYCRPVCRARTPRREHCRFFPTAAAAEAQGFRPCLRCRPELAPRDTGFAGLHPLAARAAGVIDDRLLEDGPVLPAVAHRLGVTDRHLRRVFVEAFGVSPIEYAQTQRLLLAKRLLCDTRMPITEIAFASGFRSVRRFNALFQRRYRLAPGRLRVEATGAHGDDAFRFVLRFEGPFDWPHHVRFLEKRAIDGVEEADAEVYRRTVSIDHRGRAHAGWLEVRRLADRSALDVRIAPTLAAVLPVTVGRVKRVFDLDCPVDDVARVLGELATAHPGTRLPGAFDGFEAAVRAVLGQQITVRAARTLAARFAAAFGDELAGAPGTLSRVFPTASRVARLDPSTVAAIGLVGARARSIVDLARAVAGRDIVLSPGADVEATMDRLRALPGIGPWTAEYIAMRALSWPDAFPGSDYGVLKAIGEKRPARVRALAERWRPWRAYAVMHLWRSLESRSPEDDTTESSRNSEERP